jgi:hypothetical protein
MGMGAKAPTTPPDDRPVDQHYCPDNRIDPGPCYYYEAVGFEAWSALTERQHTWLAPYLATEAAEWPSWSDQNDDRAAEFLAMTHALDRLTLILDDGRQVPASDLIEGILDIQGDRLKVKIDPAIRDAWKAAGGKFTVAVADGRTQNGSMDFADHTVLGAGELISGYDYQWFSGTVSWNSPRFHFNFRLSDQSADMHLDVAVWLWGFIPNPMHMTYSGADTRQFYGDYVGRYGAPGFQVSERTVPAVNDPGQ